MVRGHRTGDPGCSRQPRIRGLRGSKAGREREFARVGLCRNRRVREHDGPFEHFLAGLRQMGGGYAADRAELRGEGAGNHVFELRVFCGLPRPRLDIDHRDRVPTVRGRREVLRVVEHVSPVVPMVHVETLERDVVEVFKSVGFLSTRHRICLAIIRYIKNCGLFLGLLKPMRRYFLNCRAQSRVNGSWFPGAG